MYDVDDDDDDTSTNHDSDRNVALCHCQLKIGCESLRDASVAVALISAAD